MQSTPMCDVNKHAHTRARAFNIVVLIAQQWLAQFDEELSLLGDRVARLKLAANLTLHACTRI
jgi:hypothetical protein